MTFVYISHIISPTLPFSAQYVPPQVDVCGAGNVNDHTEDCVLACTARAKLQELFSAYPSHAAHGCIKCASTSQIQSLGEEAENAGRS